MELQIFADNATLFRAAAEKITVTLETALREKDNTTCVLAGGKNPEPVYKLLASRPYRSRIPWYYVDFFWGDERCVPPFSRDSNFGLAWDSLLSRVPVPGNRIHRILGELENPEQAALRYEAEIRRVVSGDDIPCFDLVLLGMGEDGHTASLFQGREWDEHRLVVADYVPKLQANRITMTPRILNAAREILILVSGADKARALAGVFNEDATDYPVKRIRPDSGSLTWMVDEAAASLLSST